MNETTATASPQGGAEAPATEATAAQPDNRFVRDLNLALRGSYETFSARAAAILSVVSSAPPDAQRALIKQCITIYGKEPTISGTPPIEAESLADDVFKEAAGRLKETVSELCARIERENLSAQRAAAMVHDKLFAEIGLDSDRVVLLALLLKQPLLPYMAIPDDLFAAGQAMSEDTLDVNAARARMEELCPLVTRILAHGELDSVQKVGALWKLIEKAKSAEERLAAIKEVAEHFGNILMRQRVASVVVPDLIRALITGNFEVGGLGE